MFATEERTNRLGGTLRLLLAVQNHLDGHQRCKLLLVRHRLSAHTHCILILHRTLYKYARYFTKRHPKVTEDEKAVEVVVRLDESAAAAQGGIGRRLTVRTVRANSAESEKSSVPSGVPSELPEDASLCDPKFVPEPFSSGMSTLTRRNEGIGAVDFTVPRHDEGDEYIW